MSNAVGLTVNIMRELSITPSHWNVKRSYSEVAKKLGVDEETVRIRVRSLRESGFLLGWRLILNANLIGKESHIVVLELNDIEHKDGAIAEFSKTDGAVLMQAFYGRTLQATIFTDSEEEFSRQMKRITSITDSKIFAHWNSSGNLPHQYHNAS